MKLFKINTSVLYPASPKEIGTGMCESLSSYIIRLSTEHNIMTGILINKLDICFRITISLMQLLNEDFQLDFKLNGKFEQEQKNNKKKRY
ncbi:hypothetical protein OF830_13995 [Bacillus paramycoides]|uniref:hypothetical protein n=1 Tax=Bacillus paramycoides TaxID=2026194 RepID=UPI002244A864|nr:hypothetical protein [Bacillus paramycoides]MCW9132041.1 hypothetical protein [Bacillus paramycoides]